MEKNTTLKCDDLLTLDTSRTLEEVAPAKVAVILSRNITSDKWQFVSIATVLKM